jgi:hypothetical protein
LKTADENTTPIIQSVTIAFTSSCVPAGRSFFRGLANDTYTLTVSRSAFQTTSTAVTVSNPWQEANIILAP